LQKLEAEASTQAKQLDNARRRLNVAEQRVKDRNHLWTPFRWVADLFEDVHTPHKEATASYSQQASELNRTESKRVAVQDKTEATVAQIQAFNIAISKFAFDCKQERGFAILQGRAKWLNPSSIE